MNKIVKTPIVVFTMSILFYSLAIPSYALTGTNAASAVSIEFNVPNGWEHQDHKDGGGLIKASYTYSSDSSEFISFGFCDLAFINSMMPDINAPDQYINSKAYMAALTGVDADAIDIVNYHGIDYYQFKTDSSSAQSGACTVIKLFCVINTTLFTFQYGSAKDSPHFTDFEQMMNRVVYTIPADSNNLEIYKLRRENKNKDPFSFRAAAIMLYSLPIFIYGYSKRKISGLR